MPLGPTNNRDASDPLVTDHTETETTSPVVAAPGAQWSTTLVGRERELNELERVALDRSTRLITITGPDGIGKTRLADSLVERIAGTFTAGIAFVPLGNVTNREIAVWSVAEALGISIQRDQPVEEELHHRIQGDRLLIVLDDLDLIPDIPEFLAQILVAADRALVVVINEHPLGITGEHVVRLAPLDHGSDGESAAADLLIQRASVGQAPRVSAPAAVDIARRTGGMPLSLELVGARIADIDDATQMNAVLADLSSHLPATPPSERDAVAGTIAWSYDQLAEPLRLALRQLSVFVAGFIPSAATTVLAGAPGGELDADPVLDALVSRSLIVPVTYDDGQQRYWMPTLIRVFAHARLEEHGEARDACQRHAEWCREYAEQAEEALKGAEQARWREWIAREISNIRSALEWLYGSGQASSALWLATALGRFWSAGAYMTEGRYWLERGLSADVQVIDQARARALDILSWLVLLQGDIAGSRAMVTDALSLFRRLGDVEGIATTLDSVAEMDLTEGDYRSAIAHLDEGQRHWREIGNRWSMAMSLITLGTATMNAGQRERSRESLMKARAIMEDVSDQRGVGLALLNLGWLYLHLNEPDRAVQHLKDALALLQRHGGALETAEALEATAAYALTQDESSIAGRLYQAARAMRRNAGIQPAFLSRLGHLDDRRGYRRRIVDVSGTGMESIENAWTPDQAVTAAEEILSRSQTSVATPTAPSLALTPRERDVLFLLAEERSVMEIADTLGISLRMATTIANNLFTRLNVTNRAQVANAARRLGLFQHADD